MAEKPNIIKKAFSYFKESKEELKKVSWPKTNVALRLTLAVIIISGIMAGFLGFFDFIFNEGINLLLKK